MWAYADPAVVTLSVADDASLVANIRSDPGSDGDVAFSRCSHCGRMMTWTGVGRREGIKKMGVNGRMARAEDVEGVERVYGTGPESVGHLLG